IEDVLPITPRENKRFAMLLLPSEQARSHAPPRIEVDVLNAANVENVVHINAAPQRLSLNVANEVALVMSRIDPVVWIEQFDTQHRRVISAHGDGPWIRFRFLSSVLLRIVKHDAAEEPKPYP